MIAFFGASVVQQSNGYAKYFQQKSNQDVKIFGYGGMHLDDAGIIYIDEVIKVKPDYCFIDFFTTDFQQISLETEEYLDTIIYKLLKINSYPIFLFLPRKDDLKRIEFYKFCKNYLVRKNVEFCDLSGIVEKNNINELLRDIVHTTNKGSEIYAEFLLNFILTLNKKKSPINIYQTKYLNIKQIPVHKSISHSIELIGSCTIIAAECVVGPHSGIILIGNDNKMPEFRNTWDIWSHYIRNHFCLKFVNVEKKIKFLVLSDYFDTSNCKINMNFEKKKKKLIIRNIYYIGADLRIGKVIGSWPIIDLFIILNNKIFSIRKKFLENFS